MQDIMRPHCRLPGSEKQISFQCEPSARTDPGPSNAQASTLSEAEHAERFQRVCNARQRCGHGRGDRHRGSIRQDYRLVRRGHSDAAAGPADRQGGLYQYVHQPLSGPHYDTLAASKAAGAATINYGVFLNTVTNFLIVAFAIFLLIHQMNRIRRPAPAAAPATKECPYCLSVVALKATRCPHCTSELRAA